MMLQATSHRRNLNKDEDRIFTVAHGSALQNLMLFQQ
jgi:hypothetical protein